MRACVRVCVRACVRACVCDMWRTITYTYNYHHHHSVNYNTCIQYMGQISRKKTFTTDTATTVQITMHAFSICARALGKRPPSPPPPHSASYNITGTTTTTTTQCTLQCMHSVYAPLLYKKDHHHHHHHTVQVTIL